jgi:predicted hotdog family 3-hydroxylacyl-ACP dehydratase
MMTFPLDNILSLIPQKHPFVMVNSLLHADEDCTRSTFHVREDNVFIKNNNFQEAGLLENMAQTAALGAGYKANLLNKPVALGYIGSVKDFEIFGLPKVNADLVTEVIIQDQIFDVTICSGKIWQDETLLAQCNMKVFLSNG